MDDEYDFRKSNIAAVGTVSADEGEEGEMSEGSSNTKDKCSEVRVKHGQTCNMKTLHLRP